MHLSKVSDYFECKFILAISTAVGKHSDLFFVPFIRRGHGTRIRATRQAMPIVSNPLVRPIFELAQARNVIKVGEGFCPPHITHGLVNGFCAAGETAVFVHKPRFAQPVHGREAQFCHALRDKLPPLNFKLSFCPRLHETRRFFSEAAIGIVD